MFLYPVLYDTLGTALLVLLIAVYALCEFLFEKVLDGSNNKKSTKKIKDETT
jgi:hypothetical protein